MLASDVGGEIKVQQAATEGLLGRCFWAQDKQNVQIKLAKPVRVQLINASGGSKQLAHPMLEVMVPCQRIVIFQPTKAPALTYKIGPIRPSMIWFLSSKQGGRLLEHCYKSRLWVSLVLMWLYIGYECTGKINQAPFIIS